MDDTAFGELSERAAGVLDRVDLDTYYGPRCRLDDALAALAETCAVATPVQRADFYDALSSSARRALGRFALRAPMLALRSRDATFLHAGLVIHALLGQQVRDWRDDLVAFAPYHVVARELGLDPVALFDGAAAAAVPDLAEVMRAFGRRRDITLGAFGWRLVQTAEGPSFEMLGWGEPQATGAVVGSPSWDAVNGAMAQRLLKWVEEQRSRSDG